MQLIPSLVSLFRKNNYGVFVVGAGWGKVGRVVGGFRLLSPLLRADELVCEMTQACRIIRTSILQKTTPPPEQDETPTHNVHAIASVCWEGELRERGGGGGGGGRVGGGSIRPSMQVRFSFYADAVTPICSRIIIFVSPIDRHKGKDV